MAVNDDQPMTVAKWSHPVPLADGTCHCGRPIKYNLRERIVGHGEPTGECAEPWPDVPAPEEYETSRRMAAELQRVGVALDRALGVEPPEHRAARERAEDEQERITGRYASGGIVEAPRDRGDDRIPAFLTRECYFPPAPEPPTKDDVIAHLREQTLARKAKANRGQGDLVDEVRDQWRDG